MTTTVSDAAVKRMADLLEAGQSVWLDFITRGMVHNGELATEINELGVRGQTSNPTIFQQAISKGTDYDEQIAEVMRKGGSATAAFEAVAISDIQAACDLFRSLYDKTNGADGFVSIEVSPDLARDTKGTIANAKHLWKAVNRPNVMIKVPGTVEGAPAVQELLTAGINVNITLLFSIENYERVINAYLAALEARAAAGKPLDHIASVASFFVSRVDTAADKLIDAKVEEVGGANTSEGHTLLKLRGKVAIANAKLAYELFQQYFSSDRFKALAAKGARPQRPLWASTGTKDKAYSDILYVESLIGPETINTVPPATLAAFRDHGTVARTIDTDLDGARETLKELAAAGISLDGITQKLEDDGIEAFAKSFDDLLAGVEEKRAQLR